MKGFFILLPVVLFAVIARGGSQTTEELISQLAGTDEAGYGYSSDFAGSQFSPRPDSARWGVGILGSRAPEPSAAMLAIVERGAEAIPTLEAHMDDARPIKMKPVKGMEWTCWNDEYDYNKRTVERAPVGVNRDEPFAEGRPEDHQITVGDLCFVALGQIVNRRFSATSYQASGGMEINSPTYSKRLLEVIRDEYGALTSEKYKARLFEDLEKPDDEYRRDGAVMRIAYYYPDELDAVAAPQLKVATYDPVDIEKFVEDVLYRTKSDKERKELFAARVKKYGPAERDGILMELFKDLKMQIDDERSGNQPSEKHDARRQLMVLYGYGPDVKMSDMPYVETWSRFALADFISALGPAVHPEINGEIYRIFLSAGDDDYLALACVKALAGTGRDEELIDYCKRRVRDGDRNSAQGYREMLRGFGKRWVGVR